MPLPATIFPSVPLQRHHKKALSAIAVNALCSIKSNSLTRNRALRKAFRTVPYACFQQAKKEHGGGREVERVRTATMEMQATLEQTARRFCGGKAIAMAIHQSFGDKVMAMVSEQAGRQESSKNMIRQAAPFGPNF